MIYLLIVFGSSGKPEGGGGENGLGRGNGVKGQGGNCGTGNSPRDF